MSFATRPLYGGLVAQLTAGLLDAYSANLWSAGGIQKLLSAYSGAAIRVRRDSDQAELDIGFIGGALDVASLMTFAGAASAFITKFYDQTGLGNAFGQTDTTAQARIVNAGVFDSTVYFDGVNDGYTCANLSPITTAFSFALQYDFRVLPSAAFGWIFGQSNTNVAGHSAIAIQYQYSSPAGQFLNVYDFYGANPNYFQETFSPPVSSLGVDLLVIDRALSGVTHSRRWHDGVEEVGVNRLNNITGAAFTAETFYLGRDSSAGAAAPMNLSHFALWTSSQTASAVALSRAMATSSGYLLEDGSGYLIAPDGSRYVFESRDGILLESNSGYLIAEDGSRFILE